MGMLIVRCPKTGEEFSTGLELEAQDASLLPDVEANAFCPACNKAHLWRPREARYAEALHQPV
jgi:predicted RNA-binding Zn-ribbon protein involved in translation (DUF1610 family)